MQRTQIYFESDTLSQLKQIARHLNISVSEYIRQVVRKEIHQQKSSNLHAFIDTMEPIESLNTIDASSYVREMRAKSRLLHD